jgi:hypothetical protein
MALAPQAEIASSVMEPQFMPPHSGPFACVIGRKFTLMSIGPELRIRSHQFPLGGCEAVRLLPHHREYLVKQVTYRDKVKTYIGTGPHGKIEIIDHRRSVNPKHPWTAIMVETKVDGVDGPVTSQFNGLLVDDQNLQASGQNSVDVLLELKNPFPLDEMTDLLYSLLLDPAWLGPIPSQPGVYQARIISDLDVQHVLNQLTVLDAVEDVELLLVNEDPWPPRM